MKIKLLFIIIAFVLSLPVVAQLDATRAKELAEMKSKSKENKTTFLIYDTVFYAGEAYCLMQTRQVSDNGDEYALKNLNGQEIIYVIEPDEIDRTIGNITGDNYYRFTLLKEGQKMNIPSKSIVSIPDFITTNALIKNNSVNMDEVKKLRLIYDDINPQQYNNTTNITTDTTITHTNTEITDTATEDKSKYLPVVRNRMADVEAKNYVIRQGGKTIGYYDKRIKNDGSEKLTVFTFYLPNKVQVAEAINGGPASVKYTIIISQSGKRYVMSTGIFNPAKDIAEYLIKYNIL